MFRALLVILLTLSSISATSLSKRLPLANFEGGPNAVVNGCVNVITGEFIESVTHLTLPGPEPLVYQSFYTNSMGWRHNHCCSANFLAQEGKRKKYEVRCFYCHPGTTCSNLISRHRTHNELFKVDLNLEENKGLTNVGQGLVSGQTNQKNYQLTLNDHWCNELTIRMGDGTLNQLKRVESPAFDSTYVIQFSTKPSKNVIEYHSEEGVAGSVSRHTRIRSVSPTRAFLYSEITQSFSKNNQFDTTTVRSNDGRVSHKYYKKHYMQDVVNGERLGLNVASNLTKVVNPNGPDITYDYWYNKDNYGYLTKKSLPEGRGLSVHYIGHSKDWVGIPNGQKLRRHDDRRNRVAIISEPVGTTDRLMTSYRFVYQIEKSGRGMTQVYNPLNNLTEYQYDDNKRLTVKTQFEGRNRNYFRQHSYMWGNGGDAQGNLLEERLIFERKTLFQHKYEYDSNGNVSREIFMGDFAGMGWPLYQYLTKTYTYSTDGMNLLLSETDSEKTTKTTYVPGTNLVAAKFVIANGKILSREFFEYDQYTVNTKKITDDGCSEDPKDVSQVTQRLITTIVPKQTRPAVGVPEMVTESYWDPESKEEKQLKRSEYTYSSEGWVTSEKVYDANDDYQYTLTWKYNDYGLVIEEVNALGYVILRDYDLNGNLIREEGPRPGHVIETAYDFSNRPIKRVETDSSGFEATSHMEYDRIGQLVAEIDEFGRRTTHKYDGYGRKISTTQPKVVTEDGDFSHPVQTSTFDGFDNPTTVVDAEGRVTESSYTVLNKPYHISYPDGTEEIMEYNLCGTLKKKVARNGVTTLCEYDPLGRKTFEEVYSSHGELLHSEQFVYRGLSLMTHIDTDGSVIEMSYDGAGRKTSVRKGERLTTYEYDTLGRESVVKRWLGDNDYLATIKVYDFLDRVIEERVEMTDGTIQSCVQYEYDEAGNKIREIRPLEGILSITETEFDCRQRPVKLTDAEGHVTVIEYQTHHLVGTGQKVLQTITTDPKGIQKIETHDALGRVIRLQKKDPFGELLFQQEMTYDKIGNRVKTISTVIAPDQNDRQIVTTWEYNSENQVICLMEAVGTSDQRITRMDYTCFGEKEWVQKPDGTMIRYVYNDLGLVWCIYSEGIAEPVCYRYFYDNRRNLILVEDRINNIATGRLYNEYNEVIEESLANGHKVGYEKDSLGRTVAVIYPGGERAEMSYRGLHLHQVSWKTYTHTYDEFDRAGHLKRATLAGASGELEIEYDAMGREILRKSPYWDQEVAYNEVGLITARTVRDEWGEADCDYHYDKLHQLTQETGLSSHTYQHDSLNNRLASDEKKSTLNDLHQILTYGDTTYKYAKSGNMVQEGDMRFVYDALDRLVKVKGHGEEIHYTYDPFHRRVFKEIFSSVRADERIDYIYRGNSEVGSVSESSTEFRILGTGLGAEIGAAVMIDLSGAVYAPVHDHLGNVVTLINCYFGNLASTTRYSAFGEVEKHSGFDHPWGFASKRRDPETNWVYFGRRFYSSELGRWTTCDPRGYAEGPNLYAYVYNNPLMLFDLYGLSAKQLEEKHRITIQPQKDWFSCQGQFSHDMNGLQVFETRSLSGRKTGVKYAPNFEDWAYRDVKSFTYKTEGKKHANLGFTCINGMYTSAESSVKWGNSLSKLTGGYSFTGVYNSSCNPPWDLYECHIGKNLQIATTPVAHLVQAWEEQFTSNPDSSILHVCHSQGAILTCLALMLMDHASRQKIHILAIGPGKYIDSKMCGSVRHIASENDPVAKIDVVGRWREEWRGTVYKIPAYPEDPARFTHTLDTKAYQEGTKKYLEYFRKELCF